MGGYQKNFGKWMYSELLVELSEINLEAQPWCWLAMTQGRQDAT